MRRRLDPTTVVELPLPPDRQLNGTYRPDLTGYDMRDITELVFVKLQSAREEFRQAPTDRQKKRAADNVRHWWSLYDRLLP
jgi:hypothetical protein